MLLVIVPVQSYHFSNFDVRFQIKVELSVCILLLLHWFDPVIICYQVTQTKYTHNLFIVDPNTYFGTFMILCHVF